MCRFITILAMALLCNFANAQTVVDFIVNSPDHNTLEAAVIAAELDDDLSAAGSFTVFAPTDAAFDALPPAFVTGLLANPTGQLAEILTYHVLGNQVLAGDLSNGQMATTLQGEDITVTINMDGVFINNAQVTVTDIPATNGVVHVLDAVMLPPSFPLTVVDVVVNSDEHTTLEAAVIAAELADDLSAAGPLTVFAPTDDAFAALPPAFVTGLLANPTGQLAEILTYHVLGGQVLAGDLSDGQMAATLQGEDITVTINGSDVFINDAQVIMTNIVTPNGVVHVLDAVMLPPSFPLTVVDVVVNSDEHTTLEAAVIAAELADDLSAAGPLTVFAPTDDAFAALPPAFVTGLLANPTGQLAEILTYHVLGGQVLAGDLSDGQMAATLQGEDITVTINGSDVFINDAQVIMTDIVTPNGVVHVLDAVMLPPSFPLTVVDVVVNSDEHTTLEAAVIAAELADDLSAAGPLTVFAPTDDAFAALPPAFVTGLLANPTGQLAEILTYHVLGGQVLAGDLSDGQMAATLQGEDITVTINGSDVFINDAQVIMTDIVTPNGVVHVLDAVMLPPSFPLTVVDVVVNSDEHTTLEAAVIAAELADDLSAAGPLTVFAPTDDAFAALPPAFVTGLLANPTGQLAEILTYHVLGGQVLAGDLSDGQMAATLQGEDITVTINGSDVFINDAQVIMTDIVTPNGVVHVLDAVMLPPSFPLTVVDVVVNSDEHTTLEAAVIAAELADDLSAAGPLTVFAPTDDAFAALPPAFVTGLLANPTGQLAEILTYHVLGGQVLAGDLSDGQMAATLQGEDITVTINGSDVFINDAQVIMTNIVTPNGVVHVLDAVMLPPSFPLTVVDVVVDSDIHTTLEAAVIAAELADDLSAAGPFTLFAPTDAAFDAVDDTALAALLADPTGDLAQVLLYHALDGQVLSGDLSDGQMATTLQGEDIEVSINADGVFINNAEVIVANTVTPNGVVHVIDAVLLPSFVNVTDLEQVSLEVFPNPTADFVQINLPQELWNTRIEVQITDFTGKVMDMQILNGDQLTLDFSNYPAGNYSILLVNDNNFAISKVIKK